jgi:23S rRNA (uracil1939-C5)-methyltransferase
MGRKNKPLPILNDIEIMGVAAEGKSIAKVKMNQQSDDLLAIFISYGCPGDIVDLQLTRKKHSFAEARIINMIKPSSIRIEPKCKHFGICGGCKWQHLPYAEQLKYKQQQVEDALTRIAKVELPAITPIVGSDNIYGYRNKMEYTFSNKKWRTREELDRGEEFTDSNNALGFHIPGAFDKVLHIANCYLQKDLGNQIRNALYDFAEANNLSFYNIRENYGLLRTLMIRTASTGENMVCVAFGENDSANIQKVLGFLSDRFPEINSLVYLVNTKLNDSISDQKIMVYKGKDFIDEEMEGLKFRINAKSFYQTNSAQAYKLYSVARSLAYKDIDSEQLPLVYDLYTGTGTIANFVAKRAKQVIGIEYVKEAIADAKINSEVNGITNTLFYAGDMKDILNVDFIKKHGKPDIIITDPPRAGMHQDVVDVILAAEPQVIVYVSCNPATQARDLALLDVKYKVTDVCPVDMFPQTHHVENVVRLELK